MSYNGSILTKELTMSESQKEYLNLAIFINNDVLKKNLIEEIIDEIYQFSVEFHKEIEEQK
jgi:hypothetical protein